MTDKPVGPPSPWARRMHAMLKRLVQQQIETLERQAKSRQGPKPKHRRKRNSGGAV